MEAYHVTTPKKLQKYQATGAILPPVRFWSTEYSARKWMQKTGRTILLTFIAPKDSYPLPIKGGAYWTDRLIYNQALKIQWEKNYDNDSS